MIARPQPDEYAPLYKGYLKRIPKKADILAILNEQPEELHRLLHSVSEEQANSRPAPGEWSIKEVLGHVIDTDRILSYRALCVARGEKNHLIGYNPPAYVEATDFNARPLSDLVEEFSLRRRADILCFRASGEEELARQGMTIDYPITARALLYIMAGHVMHHIESLKTTYQVEAG